MMEITYLDHCVVSLKAPDINDLIANVSLSAETELREVWLVHSVVSWRNDVASHCLLSVKKDVLHILK
jgi:hypothetical protein